MYNKYNDDYCDNVQGGQNSTWCKRNPCREENEGGRRHCWEEDERSLKICFNTDIDIDQEANANAEAGDGGEAEGGDAAFAAGGLLNVAINELDIEADIDLGLPGDAVEALKEKAQNTPLVPDTNTGAQGGDAQSNGGDANATCINSAIVEVDNVVIFNFNSEYPTPLTTNIAGNGNRNLEIKVNKNGETYVNGVKLDEQELGDGGKVMIYRDNNSVNKVKKAKNK